MQYWLFITIDTEEDDWGDYKKKTPTAGNIRKIPQLQEIFEKYSAIPTYLINYPVATDNYSITLFKDLYEKGKCDIGAHCHPWNTPPYDETSLSNEIFLRDLPSDLLYSKLKTVHETIRLNLKVTPTVFRAGKWNFGEKVAKALIDLNYKIDTSVLPFNYWKYSEPTCRLFSNELFGFCSYDSLCTNTDNCSYCVKADHCIIEIPPTTGFLQSSLGIVNWTITYFITHNYRILRLLNKLRIIKYRLLSPESSSLSDMINLTKVITRKGYPFINMHFHSTNLLPGKSPFVKTKKDLKIFLSKIDKYLRFASTEKISFMGMSNAWKFIRNKTKNQY